MKMLKTFFTSSNILCGNLYTNPRHNILPGSIGRESSGNPKPDGEYTITLSSNNLETGGEAFWNESKTLATYKKG